MLGHTQCRLSLSSVLSRPKCPAASCASSSSLVLSRLSLGMCTAPLREYTSPSRRCSLSCLSSPSSSSLYSLARLPAARPSSSKLSTYRWCSVRSLTACFTSIGCSATATAVVLLFVAASSDSLGISIHSPLTRQHLATGWPALTDSSFTFHMDGSAATSLASWSDRRDSASAAALSLPLT